MRRALEAHQGDIHFEHVAYGDDAFGGKTQKAGAFAPIVDPTELVVGETMRQKGKHCQQGADAFGLEFRL